VGKVTTDFITKDEAFRIEVDSSGCTLYAKTGCGAVALAQDAAAAAGQAEFEPY
jgi:hypothetical protein